MTGTGTKTDPFIPDNWDELITACGTSGAVISLPEGGEWDMNEQYPDNTPEVSLNGCTINGNGFKIRNLRVRDNNIFSLSKTSTINDVDFVNLYSSPVNNRYLFDNYYTLYLNRVRVSGELVNWGLFGSDGNCYCDACSFNMNLTNADFGKRNLRLNNGTNVKLTGTTSSSEFGAGSYGFESQIEGSILSTRGNSVFTAYYNNFGKINIGLSGFAEVKTSTTHNTVINTSIIDATTISSQLIQATAEQMKDADWLNEHGFPCGKES